jgi:hypothetical protein
MNCFISHLMNSNIKVFNTSITKTGHCTSGIDILTIETDNKTIILLDVQGFDFGDSKDDCKIMLFVFMISNIIVYNQKGILTNTVLSSFQVLTSLVVHIKDEHVKPQLLFRSIDIDYDKDEEEEDYEPENNLNDMLNDNREDQYTSVRKSIRKLFTSINCKPTFSIDKSEKKLLNSNNFIEFMNYGDNGFGEFCDYLLEKSDSSASYNSSDFINRVINVIQQINSNEKIDCKIFYSTSTQTELSIRNWEDSTIEINKYNEISVDGRQLTYDNNVVPIILYKDKILLDFDKIFSMATPSIKDIRRQFILNKFDTIIEKATETSLAISQKELEILYTKKIMIIVEDTFIDPRNGFMELYSNIIKPKNDTFDDIVKKTLWMDNVKKDYLNKIKDYVKKNTDEAKIIFNDHVEIFNCFISNNFVLLEKFIESIYIDVYIENINISFNYVISIIIEKFMINTEIKWSYDTQIVQLFPTVMVCGYKKHNLLLEKDVNNLMIEKIQDIEFENTEIKNNLLKVRNSKNYECIKDILSDYLIMVYGERFINERIEILPLQLYKLQKNMPNIIKTIDYISLKKYHNDIKILYTEFINGDNKVEYLNLFDHLINYIEYYKQLNTSPSGMKLIENNALVKYIFILSKIPLCRIYIISEFNEVYSDILSYYNLIEHDAVLLNYELVKVIIDKLFIRFVENKF